MVLIVGGGGEWVKDLEVEKWRSLKSGNLGKFDAGVVGVNGGNHKVGRDKGSILV